eukprot:TRINITY_DN5912_c0_g1_i2.p1 TRINITY_DN5912_c0_g1~~TRINITY_DN5912_c0_g1_i2.p1  ORF type:complete len:671 (-),score=147.96 TRINITY_DN5912_c0_g1_i2:65-2077(-)
MAIVQSYRFIENDCFPRVFDRLLSMIRGIADPLVATYARAYLARKGADVLRHNKKFLMQSFEDYLLVEKLIDNESTKAYLESRNISKREYLELYAPALDWILECLAHKADYRILEEVLHKYGNSSNGYVLNAIISSFQPRLICKYAIEFVKHIKSISDESIDKLILYRTLGVNLVLSEPPEEHRLKILNEIWKDVTKTTDVTKYIQVAEIYIAYPLTHLNLAAVDVLLKDILDHVNVDKQYLEFQSLLQSIMTKVLSRKDTTFHQIFGMKHFLPFLDLFRGEIQIDVNKALLQNFNKTVGKVSDTIVINTMFSVAKTVHDSINAMSFESETREISDLICKFVQKIDFGRDLEKHLNFFVEARRAFSNLDTVKAELVRGVCMLAVQTLQFVKGKLNKQTSAFVRACIAYCYITIPAMESVFERLYLYAFSGQVSLLLQSLPQADSLFKSAITLLQEVPNNIEERDGKVRSTNEELITFLKYFISILTAVPGHPDHGPFYLLTALTKVVKDFTWEAKSTGRVIIFNSIVKALSVNYQKKLPYQWDKIETNEMLYGQTEQYLSGVKTLIAGLLDEIKADFERLSQYVDLSSQQTQAEAALEVVNSAIINAQILPQTIDFIVNFYSMAKKLRAPKDQLLVSISVARSFTERTSLSPEDRQSYDKLLKRLLEVVG